MSPRPKGDLNPEPPKLEPEPPDPPPARVALDCQRISESPNGSPNPEEEGEEKGEEENGEGEGFY